MIFWNSEILRIHLDVYGSGPKGEAQPTPRNVADPHIATVFSREFSGFILLKF